MGQDALMLRAVRGKKAARMVERWAWARVDPWSSLSPGKPEVLVQLLQAACIRRWNANPVQLDQSNGLNC